MVVAGGLGDEEGWRYPVLCRYRQLNDATIKDAYPLPRIDDTLDMLAGKQWFSTLDLASGYWQVSLSREARAKTAFATHSGLFQFPRDAIWPMQCSCHLRAADGPGAPGSPGGVRCMVYLDDIISFGGTFDGALSNLTLIFERLRSYGLQLKSSKCYLFECLCPSWAILWANGDWSVIRQRLKM